MLKNSILLACICVTLTTAQEPARYAPPAPDEKIRNVIFFIGDGMGLGEIASTARKYLGRGKFLALQQAPVTGLITTYPADADITDSAAGATALSAGYKTRNGMVGVSPDSVAHRTVMDAAIGKNMRTGLVVTSAITDATPAAFVANVPSRKQQTLIADQLIHSSVNVMLGGGAEFFLPEGGGGERIDGRNLFSEAGVIGYQVVNDSAALHGIASGNVLGIFSKGGLPRRPSPSLATMTAKALELLNDGESGFFLVVEGSQIDWGGHANDYGYMTQQLMQFDAAVNVGMTFAKKFGETLVVITADHETGGISLTSDSIRGDSSDVTWTTTGHTSIPVPLFAYGPGSPRFTGFMDNTEVPKILAALLRFKFPF